MTKYLIIAFIFISCSQKAPKLIASFRDSLWGGEMPDTTQYLRDKEVFISYAGSRDTTKWLLYKVENSKYTYMRYLVYSIHSRKRHMADTGWIISDATAHMSAQYLRTEKLFSWCKVSDTTRQKREVYYLKDEKWLKRVDYIIPAEEGGL